MANACALHNGQTAFGVSAEVKHVAANRTCAAILVILRNHTPRGRIVLASDLYPHISAIAKGVEIKISLHELPRQGLPSLHFPSPSGYSMPAYRSLFLSITLPLPLRIRGDDAVEGLNSEEVELPISIRVSVGILDKRDRKWLEENSPLYVQKIAETDSVVLESSPAVRLTCEEGRNIRISHSAPIL